MQGFKVVRTSLLIIFGLSLLVYGYYQGRNLIFGPELTVTSPINGETLTSSLVEVRGTAKNVAFLSLNGRQVFVDENGTLEEQLLLSYGHTIISLKGRDKFGAEKEVTLEVVYK